MAMKFKANGNTEAESVQVMAARNRLSPEEIAWAQRQPVRGRPCLNLLRTALANAGFDGIALQLSYDRECLSFQVRVTGRAVAVDSDLLLRLLVITFRSAGFSIGFEEIAVEVDGTLIFGHTLTGPLAEICGQGAPPVER